MMVENWLLKDIYLRESETRLFFGNKRLELAFSKENGWWVGLRDHTRPLDLVLPQAPESPSLLLRVGGRVEQSGMVRNSRVYELNAAEEIGHATKFLKYEAQAGDSQVSLAVVAQESDWTLTTIYRLEPEADTIVRDLRVSYHRQGEALLRDARLLAPFVSLGPQETIAINAPGYPAPPHFPLSQAPEGIWPGLDSRPSAIPDQVQHSVDAPGSVAGLVALSNPQDGLHLLCWPYSTSEFAIQELEKQGGAVRLTTWLFLADRFINGHTLEAGRQYLRLYHGLWNDGLVGWQAWFGSVGLETPNQRPAWTDGAAIYEVHVGRAPFLSGISYEPYPTMADLVNDVPRIAGLGFEVIQVMPHWPFCGYTVHDYYQIEKQYGEPGQLKALTGLAHRLGLRVILDVVLHGCVDREIIRWDMSVLDARFHFIFGEWLKAADERSRYRDEHPEWFMQNEDGQTARIYTWAFDHLNPSYQEFLIGALKHYIDEYGVDGFRFDAPSWNCIPNWKRDLPYRASAAYYGCHHLMQRIRQEIKSAYPQALLYTEPSGPLFRSTMDLTYNYDEEWLSGSLADVVSERGFAGSRWYTGQKITARQAAEWLHQRRLSLPAGSQTVHHLDSHDTFWWGEMGQFRREAFGIEAARALFALFAFLDGGIMSYAGAEKGSEDFYRNLLRLRQATPALRSGYCDYLAVHAEPGHVLALQRSLAGQTFIPIINLSPSPVAAQLSFPPEIFDQQPGAEWLVYDVLNHEALCGVSGSGTAGRLSRDQTASLQVQLLAYGVRVLRFDPVVIEPTG